MIEVIRSSQRGLADHGWLKSFHSFSFADYYDPRRMGFGALRVINEDRVAPGMGFGTHGHRDMEIVSYVLDGALAHKDSMGNGNAIRYGDVQRMSAGTGVTHSEFNPSPDQPVHFLQIWIQPKAMGIKPSYEEKNFSPAEKRGALRLIASPNGAQGAVTINADAAIYAGCFDGAEQASLAIAATRRVYAHLARGSLTANGVELAAGDAMALTGEARLDVSGGKAAELLVFDLA